MIPYNKDNIKYAKELRKNMTPWERKLWYEFLRSYPIRFQRQKAIDEYIVDFYCAKARLIIELDGSQHFNEKNIADDRKRTDSLEKLHLKVIRISNDDVNNNFYEVCQLIDNMVTSSLPQSAKLTAPSSEGAKNKKSGLYFHIPFCRSKCPYCDFFSVKYDEKLAEKYTNKVIEEIKKYNGEFDTIYFGGGTPSIISSELIGKIINESKAHFDISPDAEITVECNPSKNLEKDFEAYAHFGVNRISLGMQSARNEERFALGRAAGKAEVAKAVHDAKKAGITNISLDLMLGTPKQTLDTLDETFEFIDKMQVAHISAYMLKIEKNTKFYEMQDRLILPNEDTVAEMYLKTIHSLKKLGFNQYEISNFSKQGFESRHNLKYWELTDYLGIGTSAHSMWQGKRFYYDENFNIIADGTGGSEEERIMLGLRLNKGIQKSLVKNNYDKFVKTGLLGETENRIFLTPQGMLVSNYIISELI